ncbi:MAG: hypothetical protein KDD39_10150 [Bdellovibrionales bacterium]|nr:hypothetical protein [Bdellovibrionales bacterium]
MGARLVFATALAVFFSTTSGIAGEVVISSVLRSCVAQLKATAHSDAEYNFRVTGEQREDTKRVESLDLPEIRRTLINTYITYPFMRSMANRRIGEDNQYVNRLQESEVSFQQLTLVPSGEEGAIVLIKGRVLVGERTLEFTVDADATLQDGSWRAFEEGRRVKLIFTKSGTCALERALLGGENALIPAACAHLVQYMRGAYGDEAPVDVEYTREDLSPSLIGTIRGLEFSGLGLNERVIVRFGASDSSEPEAQKQN